MGKLRLTVIILAAAFLMFCYGPLLQWISKPLTARDQLQKADSLVILGSSPQGEDILQTDTAKSIDYGLKLFQQDYAPRIILSGGGEKENNTRKMYDYALAKGFPPDVFLLEETTATESEKAVNTVKILNEKGYKLVILVTEPYRSARLKQIFAGHGIKVISAPADKSQLDRQGLQNKAGAARLLAKEYYKFGLYKIGNLITR